MFIQADDSKPERSEREPQQEELVKVDQKQAGEDCSISTKEDKKRPTETALRDR